MKTIDDLLNSVSSVIKNKTGLNTKKHNQKKESARIEIFNGTSYLMTLVFEYDYHHKKYFYKLKNIDIQDRELEDVILEIAWSQSSELFRIDPNPKDEND